MKEYLVTLVKADRSYYVTASSAESARRVVLNFEPSYNEDWGLEVRRV